MWVVVEGPLSPVLICVHVGLSTVCKSENVFMIPMKLSCSVHLFMWVMTGFGMSVSIGSGGDEVVQSMAWRLKSPVIPMCLSGVM